MINLIKFFLGLTFFAQTVVAQNLSPYNVNTITFANNIPVKTVKGETKEIVMEVRVQIDENATKEANKLFTELYSAGRYSFAGSVTNNELFVGAPMLNEAITLNGKEFLEDISVQIQVPEGVSSTTVYAKSNQANYGSQTATTASITRRPGLKRVTPPQTPNTQISIKDKTYFEQTITVVYVLNGEKYTPDESPVVVIGKSEDIPAPMDNKQIPVKNKAVETSPSNAGKKNNVKDKN